MNATTGSRPVLFPAEGVPNQEIDFSSVAQRLVFLRLVDYFAGFTLFYWWFALLMLFVVHRTIPSLTNICLILALGLCVLLIWRNFGVIDPANWTNYLIAMPVCLYLFASVAVELYLQPGQLFDDTPEAKDRLNGLAAAIQIVLGSALGIIVALSLRKARLHPTRIRFYDLVLLLGGKRVQPEFDRLMLQRINRKRGLTLAVVGAIPILGAALLPLYHAGSNRTILGYVSLFGFALLVRSRRYLQVSADVLLRADKRKPVLYLRSFADDEKAGYIIINESQLLDFSVETRLSNYFIRYGPFVAVGSPRDTVPQIGAARAKLSDEGWQDAVVNWIIEAQTIVMLAGKTNWVTWELRNIIERQLTSKLLLIFPSGNFIRRSKRFADSNSRLEHVRDAFAGSKWAVPLAAIARPVTLRAIGFHNNGELSVFRGRSISRDSYHLAAMLAHYDMLGRSGTFEDGRAPPSATSRHWAPIVAVIIGCLGVFANTKDLWDSRYALANSFCIKIGAFCNFVAPTAARAAAVTTAANDFIVLAKGSHKTGMPPRQADPKVRELLDVALDTTVLKSENVLGSSDGAILEDVLRWSDAIKNMTAVYILTGTGLDDFGQAWQQLPNDQKLSERVERNVVEYAPEFGRLIDAQFAMMDAWFRVATNWIEADPLRLADAKIASQVAGWRSGARGRLRIYLGLLWAPGVSDGWRRERLDALVRLTPAAAKYFTVEQLADLQASAIGLARSMQDQEIKTKLTDFAHGLGELPAAAATIDAVTNAANEFTALAKDSYRTGMPPRQADPAVKAILNIILDTTALKSQEQYSASDLGWWSDVIMSVTGVYILAGTGIDDLDRALQLSATDRKLSQQLERNGGDYAPEVGRCIDAQFAVLETWFIKQLTALRSIAKARLNFLLALVSAARSNDNWRRERLNALATLAPAAAGYFLPEERVVLRNTAIELAQSLRDREVKSKLIAFADVLGPY
jgi:hypothetical protein